ncbi:hypothetical protein KDJ21_026190 [Metabacillus litoralis]|uniref:hypothetical protein n=1 Tax=Metabacillus TaxID=2675233 RepID=UPI001B9FA908|nr:hypothetical protein [Metabacillus litoralis]UHA60155.1 hypothetical protein KDJ21_026190 [Metabacillus litoralis]
MHTTKVLKSTDFDIKINDVKVSFDDLFPGYNEQDRLGIVVRKPGGSAGASALLMSAITRFYDFHRLQLGNQTGRLRIYPEFFIFHVGKKHMDHYWMDVWTPNKEVVVEDDPEQILEAINDRGITRLLVEDIKPSTATFLPETISSAKLRIQSAIAYSSSGIVQNADIKITSCSAAESYLISTLKRSKGLFIDTYDNLIQQRKNLIVNNRIIETYRKIKVSESFDMLTSSTTPGSATRTYMSMA